VSGAELVAALREQVREWARDQSWEVRAPVLLYFAYVLVRHLGDIEYTSFFVGGINLGFHEMGHVLFRPFGEFLMIAGGTLTQWLVPVVAGALLYLRQRDPFGVAFCLCWLSTNLFSSATYVSDARGQLNLPLVSFGGQMFGADGGGDWTRMLGRLGHLEWDTRLALLFKVGGVGTMLLGLALGAWLCWEIQRARGAPPPPVPDWAQRKAPPPRSGPF
jgi:hypothetical protein